MSGLVQFRSGGTQWAIDVRHTRRVLAAGPLTPLPAPLPGVAGLMRDTPGAPALPVLSALGAGEGEHVLELDVDGHRFGLLVDEVLGVVRSDTVLIGPAPKGQDEAVVSGTAGDALVLDATALARGLAALPPGATT